MNNNNETTNTYYASFGDLARHIEKSGGSMILQNEFVRANYKLDGEIEVENGTFYDYYDGNGEEITEEEYESFREATCDFQDGKPVYFDGDGNEIDKAEFERQNWAEKENGEYFQYFVIDDKTKWILETLTDETIIYLTELDCYMWCIGHYGTRWDGVPIEIKNNSTHKIYHKQSGFAGDEEKMFPRYIPEPTE